MVSPPPPRTPVADTGLRLHVHSILDCWVRGTVAEETVASTVLMRETAGTGTGCRAPLGPPPKKGVVVSSGSVTMSWSRLWYMDWVRKIVGNAGAIVVSERETTGTRAGCRAPLGPPPPHEGGHREQRLRDVALVLLLLNHLSRPDHQRGRHQALGGPARS